VAGKGEFGTRCKDTQPPRVLWLLRRKHEYRLRQVELSCNPPHLLATQTRRVWEDREWIAAEGAIREDIGSIETIPHWLPARDFRL
jgi:hypothetical protein